MYKLYDFHRSTFINFQPIKEIDIEIADGKTVPATGKGDVRICLDSGRSITVKGVFYVPCLGSRVNLLSTGQLADKGITMFFEKNGVTLDHKATTVAKGIRLGR